ncbi:putative nicotinate phosphoribosyltransferase [Sinorhizobium phage phiM12]|uniref:Nicotinamide phosphoribosyltransferase n=1 Tax=Sinorhizobium phage phiM12 TaxID=1357423 RepID=S5MBB4_9CAUD|nr:nicotinamide phosphoribosyl transferase [Sinorhizobium phage phiM12]AGR47913.1 putative nicotinate phosphoribosyltransferase [Sinorhizobium phage phiM12]AKF13116.1 nicotinate phosphoribosyltransferase [Sinorhizobium phage phiM19]
MLNNRNIIAATDCYKFSHPFVVRRDATSATSYIEARGGWTNEVVFFGIQAFIREYLNRRLTMKVIDREERKAKSAMVPFNRVMWERVGFPIISIVADSFDLDRFVSDYIGTALKEKIETRDGWIVVRPDSGVPEEIVPHVLRLLDDKFGSTVNSKGFKVLNPKVRVIQGDGVNRDSIDRILEAMMVAGFSAENVVFGMGGQLLQAPMRDDFSWAMKTNEIVVDGEKIDVQKRPKTDMSKASKAGRQAVVFNGKELVSIRESDLIKANARGGHGVRNWLELVWDTGKVYRTQTFAEVRANAKL